MSFKSLFFNCCNQQRSFSLKRVCLLSVFFQACCGKKQEKTLIFNPCSAIFVVLLPFQKIKSIMHTPIFYWTFIACFLQLLSPLLATTYVGQSIGVPTTWNKAGSPYIVTENLTIQEGITLIIEEGCLLHFSEKAQLLVAGNLVATGSPKQPIIFEGLEAALWRGVVFLKTATDYNPKTKKGVQLKHCVFRGSLATTYTLLNSKGCDLLMEHCQLEDCYTALQTERQAELWLQHSTFKNCNRALHVRNTSIGHIQYNKFLNCNSILLGGTTIFEYNSLKRFTSNSRHSGLIVWMLGGGKATIRHNQFQRFEDYALKVYKLTQRSSVVIEKNDFKNNPVNLKLCCQYYNVGTVSINNNNFHNFYRHQVQIYGRCEETPPVSIAIGRNYWGNLSLADLKSVTADQAFDATIEAVVKYSAPLEKAVKLD